MSDSHRRSGRSASKLRSTRSAGRAALSSGMVVRLVSPLTTPFRPSRRMRRSTVQRATPIPSRCSWRHTLRAPYTPNLALPHPANQGAQLPVPAAAGRATFGFALPAFVLVVNRRGDRQLSTDRLDPVVGSRFSSTKEVICGVGGRAPPARNTQTPSSGSHSPSATPDSPARGP